LDVAGAAVSSAREYRVFTPSQARELEQALAVVSSTVGRKRRSLVFSLPSRYG